MTGNDIIKALECCGVKGSCTGCYFNTHESEDICARIVIQKALDLINRQKAEIEEQDQAIINALKRMGQIRAEAITEFAERLKGKLVFWDCGYCGDSMADEIRQYTFDTIDQIAKEMKGESEWGMQKLQQPQGDNDVKCKDCEYLMFSDCYGECRKAYKGIVNPNDSCGKGKKRVKGEQ